MGSLRWSHWASMLRWFWPTSYFPWHTTPIICYAINLLKSSPLIQPYSIKIWFLKFPSLPLTKFTGHGELQDWEYWQDPSQKRMTNCNCHRLCYQILLKKTFVQFIHTLFYLLHINILQKYSSVVHIIKLSNRQ